METNVDLESPDNLDNQWKSCCNSVIDRRATIFFSQFALTMIIVVFCCYQLVKLDNCEAQSLYSGIITFILGVYLPNPKLQKR